ncbi:MAG TPA: Gfo/Idh/MocA family oxidoreductase [Chthonomonadaceae bacterium]|nr:Gfo/Idh/MocA family oxidoreductase [Chthonomonadaceae bacterium]
MEKHKRGMTRRDLVKRTATAATTFAIPTLIPSGVLAYRGRPGANDRIVYAHIGVGGMGHSHVVPDAAAICDANIARAHEVAKNQVQGNPLVCQEFRRILDRKDIDAVTIGAPDHWHAIMTVMACQAGKDVYSEKPVCKTIQEGQAMVNAKQKFNRVVQIGAQGRSNPNARAAAEFIRNGQIGRVTHVKVWHPLNMSGDGWGEEREPPSELDWNIWLGPARWRPYNPVYVDFAFRWMMDFGAGFIRDRGNHVLSIVSWCMGTDEKGPVSVEATGKQQPNSVFDAPVGMSVTWQFRNPDWTLTWDQPGEPETFPGQHEKIEWGAKYFGDRDTLIVSGGDGGCDTEQKAKDYHPQANQGIHLYWDSQVTANDPTERHRQNWRRCIKTRERTAMPIEIGYKVITLPIIANISYLLGRKLRWDPEGARFLNDEEANRLLVQPYRAPWHL